MKASDRKQKILEAEKRGRSEKEEEEQSLAWKRRYHTDCSNSPLYATSAWTVEG
ncbi:hypothetical protein U1Q18_012265 [Sarracenia purpurea var. burkii]